MDAEKSCGPSFLSRKTPPVLTTVTSTFKNSRHHPLQLAPLAATTSNVFLAAAGSGLVEGFASASQRAALKDQRCSDLGSENDYGPSYSAIAMYRNNHCLVILSISYPDYMFNDDNYLAHGYHG